MKRALSLFTVLLLAGLPACGGGGGGGSSPSPYTGLQTPAVITSSNADNIASGAFQGGDLGANATLSPVRSGDTPAAGMPVGLPLVRVLSGVSNTVFKGAAAVRAPVPRTTETGTIPDDMGIGRVDYTMDVNDQTGAFTGLFTFTNFHGDGGGIIDGPVAVSGVVYSQTDLRILFDFQSVRFVDGAEDATAFGTVDLTAMSSSGNATLNMVFRDNVTRKTLWLSNFSISVTDLAGATQVWMSGRIYLHDYGYVDVQTPSGFIYPTGSTLPTYGQLLVTGDNSRRVQLTVVSQTQYTLDVDTNGDGLWEVTADLKYW